ncbi:MAG TPA: FIST C-terminal domain-containing protein [Burkholderiales bacterium]|nr:FIST C-terminal domain-containing protein [Burkholderiales bacterium]
MDRFVSAHSAAPDALAAADDCIGQLGSAAAGANLGFVYASDAFAAELPEILTRLERTTGVAEWTGSVGVGISAPGREYHETPALSLLLGRFPEGSFRVFAIRDSGLPGFLREHGDWIRDTGCRFGVVHGDPTNPRLPALIGHVANAMSDGFLVGGLTSSRESHLQVAGKVTSGGLSGVLFAPEVAVATHLTQSCLPFGETHEITDCGGGVVATLDHRPALDVFSEEVGDILTRDLRQAARYIGAALPVPGSDTADYLVRNLVGFDPRRRLLAIGEALEPGQRVRFCRRDPVGARQDLERMLAELRGRVGATPRGGLYFSCVGRGRHLFGDNSEELSFIEREFPGLPLAGFFCSGEISFNRLYGYTGVLALFL